MKDTLNFFDYVGAYLWLSILSIFGILRIMVILNYEKMVDFEKYGHLCRCSFPFRKKSISKTIQEADFKV